jgi:predicted transglutaminase-like cysteine proteinase
MTKSGAVAVRGLVRAGAMAAMLIGFLVPVANQAQTYASLPKSGSVGRIEANGPARPVKAWSVFCERYAGECDVNPNEAASITLNAKLWKALNAVNLRVNTAIKPTTDQDHWGLLDRWDMPSDGRGDCEDMQLLKRKMLVEQHGLPKRALRMTVVIDEQGEGHAVLMVRTDEGELILDNKRDSVLPWHQTGYIFVKREGQDSRSWVSLGDRSSVFATANQ